MDNNTLGKLINFYIRKSEFEKNNRLYKELVKRFEKCDLKLASDLLFLFIRRRLDDLLTN